MKLSLTTEAFSRLASNEEILSGVVDGVVGGDVGGADGAGRELITGLRRSQGRPA